MGEDVGRLQVAQAEAGARVKAVQETLCKLQLPWRGVCTVVLVPFRDLDPRQRRGEQLDRFMAHMPKVLDAALGAGTWSLLILEQPKADGKLFCRGRLLNAGARLASKWFPEATSWVLHDVDLLPDAGRAAAYAAVPANELRALNTDSYWYRDCAQYTGGICAVAPRSFETANGFQCDFQGWGGEDDCFRDSFLTHIPGAVLTGPCPGSVVDLEKEAGHGYRCATDPAAKMAADTRKTIKLAARAAHYKSKGLHGFCFEMLGAARVGPSVLRAIVDVFPTTLGHGWTTAVSSVKGTMFYLDQVHLTKQLHRPAPALVQVHLGQPLADKGLDGEAALQICWAGWAQMQAAGIRWPAPASNQDLVADVLKLLGFAGLHMEALRAAVKAAAAADSIPAPSPAVVSSPDSTAIRAAAESSAAESSAAESTAAESTAAATPMVVPVESTAAGSTAAGSTAVERTAVERTAAESTAAESTAAESTAVERTAVERTAAESTAAESTAAESTAAESTAAATPMVVPSESTAAATSMVVPESTAAEVILQRDAKTEVAAFPSSKPSLTSCQGWPCGMGTWAQAKGILRKMLDAEETERNMAWITHVARQHGDVPEGTDSILVRSGKIVAMPSYAVISFGTLRASKKQKV